MKKHTQVYMDLAKRYKNQIDHVLINNIFKNSILKKTLREADINSDHLLIGIWIKVKIKMFKKYKKVINKLRTN